MRFVQYYIYTVQFRSNAILYKYYMCSSNSDFIHQYISTAQRQCDLVQNRYYSTVQRAILYSTTVQLRDNAFLYGSTCSTAKRQCVFVWFYMQYSSETMRFCMVLHAVQLRDNVILSNTTVIQYSTVQKQCDFVQVLHVQLIQ